MGSGASTTGANDGVVITSSAPTGVPGDKPLGWTASAAELSAQSGRWTIEVYVICATVTGWDTRRRDLRGAAEAAPLLRGQTSSASAAEGARREGLGWTASASEVVAGSERWTLEVYVTCATVTG